MTIYVKESSTWREVQQPYVNTSSTWRTIQTQSVKDAGTWKSVFPSVVEGGLWTWGLGVYGSLGTNNTTNRSTPVTTFAGGANWNQVEMGRRNAIAIKTDGTLWTWGFNTNGSLGNNSSSNYSTPITTFAGGTNWQQCSAGSEHMAAVKTDGTLWLWGRNGVDEGKDGIRIEGQLGSDTGGTFASSTPITTFAGGTNWKQVSCGEIHTAAIKTDGTLWTWGYNALGQLGTNDTTQRKTPSTTFAGGTNWKQVSSSEYHTAAIKTDGTLWIWGATYSGRLGNAVTVGTVRTPITTFAGGTTWKQVSVGRDHTAAIKTDGTLWIWGSTGNGKLGNAVTGGTVSTPITTFAGGTNWKQVSCGERNTSAIKTDGTLWTWGYNSIGQLGNAVTGGNVSTPITTFAGGTTWKQTDLSIKGATSAAIKS